jgi:hypothetical protein
MEAAAAIVRGQAEREAAEQAKATQDEQRRILAASGLETLGDISAELLARIDQGGHGQVKGFGGGILKDGAGRPQRWEVCGRTMGRARLFIAVPYPLIPENAFPHSKLRIVEGAVIAFEQSGHPYCGGRGANLWYGDLRNAGGCEWYEQAYMVSALSTGNHPPLEPFGVTGPGHLKDVDEAHSMTAMLQRASKLRRIEGDGLEAFLEKWVDRFAAAAVGGLDKPNPMPDEDVNAP